MTPQEMAAEGERLRDGMRAMLKRVPAGVNAGSYQNAVNFKAAARKAGQCLAKPGTPYLKLKSIHTELQAFY